MHNRINLKERKTPLCGAFLHIFLKMTHVHTRAFQRLPGKHPRPSLSRRQNFAKDANFLLVAYGQP